MNIMSKCNKSVLCSGFYFKVYINIFKWFSGWFCEEDKLLFLLKAAMERLWHIDCQQASQWWARNKELRFPPSVLCTA